MADQSRRLSYGVGKGGFLRILWRPSVSAVSGNLVVLPNSTYECMWDPGLEDMTESDSIGRLMMPTLETCQISVNLRKRFDSVSLEALGIRAVSFVDAVAIDHGASGMVDWFAHMSVGPYTRSADQRSHIMEGFTLTGGAIQGRGVACPSWALATSGGGGIPNLAGYFRTGVSLPTGL